LLGGVARSLPSALQQWSGIAGQDIVGPGSSGGAPYSLREVCSVEGLEGGGGGGGGGGNVERWRWRGREVVVVVVVGRRPPDAESKGWGKGRVCERRPQLISRGRARAWATQRSRHAAQHKRGPEEDLAATASSVARLWARGQGQARKGICGVRDSAQVMCCVVAALSTGQPDQNASPASVPLTHPLPLPPPLPRPLARRLCLSLAGSARTLRGMSVKAILCSPPPTLVTGLLQYC